MKVEATVNRAPCVREKVCFDAGVKGRPSHQPRFCYHTSHGLTPGSRGHLNLATAVSVRQDRRLGHTEHPLKWQSQYHWQTFGASAGPG